MGSGSARRPVEGVGRRRYGYGVSHLLQLAVAVGLAVGLAACGNGDVPNEAQFSQTALPELFEADQDHVIELTEGRYRITVSAAIDEDGYEGSLAIERVE